MFQEAFQAKHEKFCGSERKINLNKFFLESLLAGNTDKTEKKKAECVIYIKTMLNDKNIDLGQSQSF